MYGGLSLSLIYFCHPSGSAVVPLAFVIKMVAWLQSLHLVSAFLAGLLTSKDMDE